jgi:hypothetical protein
MSVRRVAAETGLRFGTVRRILGVYGIAVRPTRVKSTGVGPREHRVSTEVGAEELRDLQSGEPTLLVLDNADRAFVEEPGFDPLLSQVMEAAAAGATVVVTLRSVETLPAGIVWDEVMTVEPFSSWAAREVFDLLAPKHVDDGWVGSLLEPCEALPLAVALVARAASLRDDLGLLGQVLPRDLSVAEGRNRRASVAYACAVASDSMSEGAREAWAALSCLPGGVGSGDLAVLGLGAAVEDHLARLVQLGIATRGGAGLRVPGLLRSSGADSDALYQLYALRAAVAIADPASGTGWAAAHETNLVALSAQSPPPSGLVDLGCAAIVPVWPCSAAVEAAFVSLVAAGVGDSVLPRLVDDTAVRLKLAGRNRPAAGVVGDRRRGFWSPR